MSCRHLQSLQLHHLEVSRNVYPDNPSNVFINQMVVVLNIHAGDGLIDSPCSLCSTEVILCVVVVQMHVGLLDSGLLTTLIKRLKILKSLEVSLYLNSYASGVTSYNESDTISKSKHQVQRSNCTSRPRPAAFETKYDQLRVKCNNEKARYP
ncbi:hypothetical protein A4A49_52908 [Nicotiana attenuata]|uniref:Uncharacterized protein n=1 Tax=Nicotiana attenuata TaxID=49451 RepID=A0A314LCR5_NICAT|nr:hypothetical protein A4A49_52908 [Nicotiana attenuata]